MSWQFGIDFIFPLPLSYVIIFAFLYALFTGVHLPPLAYMFVALLKVPYQ